jgi:hypothetical protein
MIKINNIQSPFIICFLVSQMGFSQATRLQTKEWAIEKDLFKAYIEVLANDSSVKHGNYCLSEIVLKDSVRHSHNEVITEDSLRYYTLLTKGNYKIGKKDSIWKENFGLKFYRIGHYKDDCREGLWQEFYDNQLCGEGFYQSNKKIGNWKYYTVAYTRNADKTYLIYNYDKDSILLLDTTYMVREDIQFNNRFDNPELTTNPVFPYGGYNGLVNVLNDFNMHIWPWFFSSSVFNIYYRINLDENGTLKTKVIRVNKDEHNYLANFFNRHLRNIPTEWIAAQSSENKKIPCVTIYKFKIAIE